MGFEPIKKNKNEYKKLIKASNIPKKERNSAFQVLENEHINEIFSQIATNNAINDEKDFKAVMSGIIGDTTSSRASRVRRLKTYTQHKRSAAEEAEIEAQKLYYRGAPFLVPEMPVVQENLTDNTTNNCYIFGHGLTISKQYMMIPEGVHLKFYVSKGESLKQNKYESALSSYSSRENAPFADPSHLLSPDSITHNVSIGLLTIFKKNKNPTTGKITYGNTSEDKYNSINYFEHSGIFVGSYIKPFKNISAEEYSTMNIRLFNINEDNKVLSFGDNIYGIIRPGRDRVLIINSFRDEEDQENYEGYKELVNFALEIDFARHHRYPIMGNGSNCLNTARSYYTPEMRRAVEELKRNLNRSIDETRTMSENVMSKIFALSFYNHMQKERIEKSILSYNDIKERRYQIGLGEVLSLVHSYNRDKTHKVNICQGLVCRSWDDITLNEAEASESASASASASRKHNIGFAGLARQSSNTMEYKQIFNNITLRCGERIKKISKTDPIVIEYKNILRNYQEKHKMNIHDVNFLLNLANGNIRNVNQMKTIKINNVMAAVAAENEGESAPVGLALTQPNASESTGLKRTTSLKPFASESVGLKSSSSKSTVSKPRRRLRKTPNPFRRAQLETQSSLTLPKKPVKKVYLPTPGSSTRRRR